MRQISGGANMNNQLQPTFEDVVQKLKVTIADLQVNKAILESTIDKQAAYIAELEAKLPVEEPTEKES